MYGRQISRRILLIARGGLRCAINIQVRVFELLYKVSCQSFDILLVFELSYADEIGATLIQLTSNDKTVF